MTQKPQIVLQGELTEIARANTKGAIPPETSVFQIACTSKNIAEE
jgi:hypothetical protein